MAKEGSTLSGIMDAFALSVSISLQYGVPLRALVDKFVNSRFEPSGYTGNPANPLREIDRGLHRPLARREIHLARLSRRDAAAAETTASVPAVLLATPASQVSVPIPKTGEPETSTHSRGEQLIDDATIVLRVRHADDAQRQLLQVRELRQHVRLQLGQKT